jgi:hypothetical protein
MPRKNDMHVVPSPVMVVDGVERLMEVPDEMDQELQGLFALLLGESRIRNRATGSFQLGHDAIPTRGRATVTRRIVLHLAVGNVDKMPVVGTWSLPPNLIGPGRRGDKVI